ncbi:hypothetical protein [Rhodococcus pyridinivorans]|nr:hypothetical protein [Rhodococcus pyridinivorans]MCD2142115.1 hypothetical protein [Rhodococcus pyridinivorans]
MNRQTIVERALCVLIPLLGFALLYGLPMLGMKVAIEHGWYVASAATIIPFLRATPLERISEILGYHEHDRRRCAHVVLAELDGAPEFECCIWVDELHIEGVPQPHTLFRDVTKNPQISQVVGVSTLDGRGMKNTPEEILASLDPDGGFVTLSETQIGDALTVIHDRYYSSTPGAHPEECVLFDPVSGGSLSAGSITPDQIPALIDTLTEIHRTWRENGGAL